MPRKLAYRPTPPRICRRCGEKFQGYGKRIYCDLCKAPAKQETSSAARRRFEAKHKLDIDDAGESWCQVYLHSLLPVTGATYPDRTFIGLVRSKQILFGFFERWDGRTSTVYQVTDGKLERVREVST